MCTPMWGNSVAQGLFYHCSLTHLQTGLWLAGRYLLHIKSVDLLSADEKLLHKKSAWLLKIYWLSKKWPDLLLVGEMLLYIHVAWPTFGWQIYNSSYKICQPAIGQWKITGLLLAAKYWFYIKSADEYSLHIRSALLPLITGVDPGLFGWGCLSRGKAILWGTKCQGRGGKKMEIRYCLDIPWSTTKSDFSGIYCV